MEANPDAIFAFNPGWRRRSCFHEGDERTRFDQDWNQALVTGDVVADDLLPAMGDSIDGVVSAAHYQVELDNAANAKFLKSSRALRGHRRCKLSHRPGLRRHGVDLSGVGKDRRQEPMRSRSWLRSKVPRSIARRGSIQIDPQIAISSRTFISVVAYRRMASGSTPPSRLLSGEGPGEVNHVGNSHCRSRRRRLWNAVFLSPSVCPSHSG